MQKTNDLEKNIKHFDSKKNNNYSVKSDNSEFNTNDLDSVTDDDSQKYQKNSDSEEINNFSEKLINTKYNLTNNSQIKLQVKNGLLSESLRKNLIRRQKKIIKTMDYLKK
jgi:hypothetical protein